MGVLYDDGRCLLDDDGLVLRRYYFPFGTSKRIGFDRIRGVQARPMGWLSGRGRGWGTSDPRYWFPLDMTRSHKSTLIVLDIAARVKPVFSPDRPDEVLRILREHLPRHGGDIGR